METRIPRFCFTVNRCCSRGNYIKRCTYAGEALIGPYSGYTVRHKTSPEQFSSGLVLFNRTVLLLNKKPSGQNRTAAAVSHAVRAARRQRRI